MYTPPSLYTQPKKLTSSDSFQVSFKTDFQGIDYYTILYKIIQRIEKDGIIRHERLAYLTVKTKKYKTEDICQHI